MLIRVEDLTFRYAPEAPPVLDRVSLHIAPGEFVAVLGRNGSGKSTLARHLNGLLIPQAGRVLVEGRDTADSKAVWAIRTRVGMVFQNPDNQIVATTVEEDVAFGPENLALPTDEIVRRVDSALAAVGLQELRRREPHLLSGGQKQRLAIAGALAMQPVCLVLDEATAMLDPAGRQEVAQVVERLHREQGMAVVWITHFMDEAARAERVVVLHQGRVALDGPPREVLTDADRLRSLGLELPPAVEAAEALRQAGVAVPAGILTLEELAQALWP
jgi:energy-coupling factor transport system ATP-binding protein